MKTRITQEQTEEITGEIAKACLHPHIMRVNETERERDQDLQHVQQICVYLARSGTRF